jgi:hypothetical protein
MPVFYVYILQSEATGRFYTGQTQDVEERVAYHNASWNRPVCLVTAITFFPPLFHVSLTGQALRRSGMLLLRQGLVPKSKESFHGIASSIQ